MTKPRVLVVEDEPPLRELVAVTLGGEFECDAAGDGDAALVQLRSRTPALVVLDAMLPGRSGIEVLREMRADDELRQVPVLMLSAWQSPFDVAAALDAGANSFLGKPFRVEELLGAALALVEGRE